MTNLIEIFFYLFTDLEFSIIAAFRQHRVRLLRTQPLNATCTLEGDLDTVTARNITFKFRKTLNPRYVRVVNDSLAILTHDPRNFEFDSGRLRCMIGKEQMDAVYIEFGGKYSLTNIQGVSKKETKVKLLIPRELLNILTNGNHHI